MLSKNVYCQNKIYYLGSQAPDCLPILPSSSLSATKLIGVKNGEDSLITSMEKQAEDSDSISPTITSKGEAQGLEVIQNISVKDACVIGFMLVLWLYSMILMFRY